MPTVESIYAIKKALWTQMYTHWATVELFSIVWWSIVIFLVVAYTIWWKYLDKSRLVELLLFGSLVAVMSAVVDVIADNLTLWAYRIKIFPFMPGFFPLHLTLAPIIFMIVYQYTDNWRKYLIGTFLAGAIYSFVISPTIVHIGEIELLRWNYGYIFITLMFRVILARWVVLLCKQIQTSYQKDPSTAKSYSLTPQPAMKPVDNNEEDNNTKN